MGVGTGYWESAEQQRVSTTWEEALKAGGLKGVVRWKSDAFRKVSPVVALAVCRERVARVVERNVVR